MYLFSGAVHVLAHYSASMQSPPSAQSHALQVPSSWHFEHSPIIGSSGASNWQVCPGAHLLHPMRVNVRESFLLIESVHEIG